VKYLAPGWRVSYCRSGEFHVGVVATTPEGPPWTCSLKRKIANGGRERGEGRGAREITYCSTGVRDETPFSPPAPASSQMLGFERWRRPERALPLGIKADRHELVGSHRRGGNFSQRRAAG
jgi:hypothetical protein